MLENFRLRFQRPGLFLVFVSMFVLGSSPGCVARGPVPWRGEYFRYFEPGDGLEGCPDLAGTYLVAGEPTDYVIYFPLPPILPVWWGQYPERPRLDVDMGLVLSGGTSFPVEGAALIRLAQPDADHLMITVMDESGHSIEGFEEIDFVRSRRGVEDRSHKFSGRFFCSTSNALFINWGHMYPQSGTSERSSALGRLPDGSLAVRTHAYLRGAGLFDMDQQWHVYESASTPELLQ